MTVTVKSPLKQIVENDFICFFFLTMLADSDCILQP